MAIEELNNRIQELATEIRGSEDLDTVKESADLMIKYSQLQASVTSSFEIALDTVLKQNMTLACNTLLARRDSLLKDCSSKLGPKDLANLRTDHFDQQEVFNSDILSQVEDNMIKRLSIMKDSDSKSYRDSVKNFDFGGLHIPSPLRKVTGRFVTNERSQTPLTTTSLRAHREEAERGSDFPGTRLQDFWQVWAKNQAHPRVVSLLQHGYRLDFKILPKLSKILLILSKCHNRNKDGALHEAVQAMLAKKAITHVRKPSTLGYYSRLFLVPKPMKRWRPVIDLSMLNNHLHVPTFKMETAESIRKSIRKGEWVTSIDLTDAYFHVLIHPQSQKYLRFQTKKRGFPISGSPFWCRNSSPRVYSHCERGKTHSSSQEPQNPSISGRLASLVTNKGSMSQRFGKFSEIGPRTRLAHQFPKIGIGSHTKSRLSGLSLRSSEGSGLSNPKETRSVKSSDCFHQKVISLDSKKAHVTHRDISFLRKNSTSGKVTHEIFSVVP